MPPFNFGALDRPLDVGKKVGHWREGVLLLYAKLDSREINFEWLPSVSAAATIMRKV
jgi:hypothetical protein